MFPTSISRVLLIAGLTANATVFLLLASSQRVIAQPASATAAKSWAVTTSAEVEDRTAIQQKVQALLTARNYEALDRMAEELRRTKAAYVDGYWKLWAFYGSFGKFLKGAPEARWQEALDALRDWIKQRPDSITARVALAEALTTYAWKARGSGYADTVSGIGWKLFEQRLAESREVLEQAKALKANCPHSFAVAQSVALGEGWPRVKYEKLFNQAIQYEPTYASYYFRKLHYLMPRWQGKEGEWEEFADAIANQVGGEEGDMLYARMAWFVIDLGYYKNVFFDTPINGNRVKRGYELLRRQYPDSVTVTAQFARTTAMNKDPYTTRAMLDRLDGKIALEIWISRDWFEQVRDWAYNATGGLTPERQTAKTAIWTNVITTPINSELTLNGVSGPQGRSLALINGQTFAAGESARIHLGQREVKVRCEEIRSDSVVVTVNDQPERRELRFRAAP